MAIEGLGAAVLVIGLWMFALVRAARRRGSA